MKYMLAILVAMTIAVSTWAAVSNGDTTKCEKDTFHGGTARQWYEVQKDQTVIALKYKAVAHKYRNLNDTLLQQLGE